MEAEREKTSVEPVVKIEEWLFLILIAMLPIINFIVFGYFCFNRRLIANKRNFSIAVLIYLVIIVLLASLTGMLS